jgi:lysozyme family protein
MAKGMFKSAYRKVRVSEGGYVNHPRDPGRATMKGITQATYNGFRARQGLPRQHVKLIDDTEVEAIYKRQYWDSVRGDELPKGVDYVVFDGAIHSGPSQSVKWLQRALGTVRVDGLVGEATLLALEKHNNHDELVAKILRLRLAFCRELPTWDVFGKGWTNRLAHVRQSGQAWASGLEAPKTPKPAETQVAKADPADLPPARSEKLETAADASIATGPLTTTVSGAATQLEPIAHGNDTLMWIFVALTLAGILLTAGGFALRWYLNRRAARRAKILNGDLEAELPETVEADEFDDEEEEAPAHA